MKVCLGLFAATLLSISTAVATSNATTHIVSNRIYLSQLVNAYKVCAINGSDGSDGFGRIESLAQSLAKSLFGQSLKDVKPFDYTRYWHDEIVKYKLGELSLGFSGAFTGKQTPYRSGDYSAGVVEYDLPPYSLHVFESILNPSAGSAPIGGYRDLPKSIYLYTYHATALNDVPRELMMSAPFPVRISVTGWSNEAAIDDSGTYQESRLIVSGVKIQAVTDVVQFSNLTTAQDGSIPNLQFLAKPMLDCLRQRLP